MAIKQEDGRPVWAPCLNCRKDPFGILLEVCDDCWGTYCRHGHKIMQVIPETRGKGHAREGKIVDPWPCNEGCTRDSFEAELDEEVAAYWESQRPEW